MFLVSLNKLGHYYRFKDPLNHTAKAWTNGWMQFFSDYNF